MSAGSSRTAAAFVLAAALTTGAASTAAAEVPPADHWSPVLTDAEASGVTVGGDGARLDPSPAAQDGERTGLLTLPARTLAFSTDRVETAVTGDVPAGSTATADVRGRRATGGWTEWLPAEPDGAVELPEPATQVQGRLVLSGPAATGPVVRALDLRARPAVAHRITVAKRPVLSYRVFATREGLVDGTTANGHVIGEDDYFVALPSRRALAPRGTGDYSVRVCRPAPKDSRLRRCAYAPVWDVGPWNTRDDYWNPARRRQEWNELPQGVPQAQMAHLQGFNSGLDQYDRKVLNPAGIDLSDAVFHDALGMTDNGWVTVDYLWTGADPLASVAAGAAPVQVRAVPTAAAPVVGLAAASATLPVACRVDHAWLQIGDGQFVPTAAVRAPARTPTCSAAAGPPPASTG